MKNNHNEQFIRNINEEKDRKGYTFELLAERTQKSVSLMKKWFSMDYGGKKKWKDYEIKLLCDAMRTTRERMLPSDTILEDPNVEYVTKYNKLKQDLELEREKNTLKDTQIAYLERMVGILEKALNKSARDLEDQP